MPIHSFEPLRGRIETISVSSKALESNLLGDPSERSVAVYLPPSYDAGKGSYPLFIDLAGFTGSALKQIAWKAFGESLVQRIERLVATGQMGEVVCVFPDCFTSLGGNQYINSLAMGDWETFLTIDLVNALEARYRLLPGPAHRALFGKSSGGYGSLIHGLKHADVWGAVACHSGDIDFNLAYRNEFAGTLTALERHGGIARFLKSMELGREVNGRNLHTLMVLAMGATYDPDPSAPKGIRLPVDPKTCQLDPERWRAWLEHDPLLLVDRPEQQSNLRKLKGLFIDCGNRDQYHLHFGARAFTAKLQALNIDHHYEEFDDTHSGIDYRMDVSLPFLYDAVGGS